MTTEYRFNPLTNSFEAVISPEERAARLVKLGMQFDEALLLVLGERQDRR